MVNEIFKPGVIGSDLQCALLDLYNQCKSQMLIPDFMNIVNITSIMKRKKTDKLNIESYRGIFITSIFRTILMKLIYRDKQSIIDSHMT